MKCVKFILLLLVVLHNCAYCYDADNAKCWRDYYYQNLKGDNARQSGGGGHVGLTVQPMGSVGEERYDRQPSSGFEECPSHKTNQIGNGGFACNNFDGQTDSRSSSGINAHRGPSYSDGLRSLREPSLPGRLSSCPFGIQSSNVRSSFDEKRSLRKANLVRERQFYPSYAASQLTHPFLESTDPVQKSRSLNGLGSLSQSESSGGSCTLSPFEESGLLDALRKDRDALQMKHRFHASKPSNAYNMHSSLSETCPQSGSKPYLNSRPFHAGRGDHTLGQKFEDPGHRVLSSFGKESSLLSNPLMTSNKFPGSNEVCKPNSLYPMNAYDDDYRSTDAAGQLSAPYSVKNNFASPTSADNLQPLQYINGNKDVYNNLIENLHKKIDHVEKSLKQLTDESSSQSLPDTTIDQNDDLSTEGNDNVITKIYSNIVKGRNELPSNPSDDEPLGTGGSIPNVKTKGNAKQVDDPYDITEIHKKIAKALRTDDDYSYRNELDEINNKIAEAEKPLYPLGAEDSMMDTISSNDGHSKIVEQALPHFIPKENLKSNGFDSKAKRLDSIQSVREDYRGFISEIENLIAEADKPIYQYQAPTPKSIDMPELTQSSNDMKLEFQNDLKEIRNKIAEAEMPLAHFIAEKKLRSVPSFSNTKSFYNAVNNNKNNKDYRYVNTDTHHNSAEAEKPMFQYKAEDSLDSKPSSKFLDKDHKFMRNGNGMGEIHNKVMEAEKPPSPFSDEAHLMPLQSSAKNNKDDFFTAIAELNNLIAEAKKPLSLYTEEAAKMSSTKLIGTRNALPNRKTYDGVYNKITESENPLDGINHVTEAEKSLADYNKQNKQVPTKHEVSCLKCVQGVHDYSGEIAEIHKKITDTEKWLSQCKAEDSLHGTQMLKPRLDGNVYCDLLTELHRKSAKAENNMDQCIVGNNDGTSKLRDDGSKYRNALTEIANIIAEAEKPIPQCDAENIFEPSELMNSKDDIENVRRIRTLTTRGQKSSGIGTKTNIRPAKNSQEPANKPNYEQTTDGKDHDTAERFKDILGTMRKHTSEMMKNMCDLESDLMATDISHNMKSTRSMVHQNKKSYANLEGDDSELKTLKDHRIRFVEEPLGEAQYDANSMLLVPMPSPMMMMGTSPKTADTRVPSPQPKAVAGIKNGVPSDKLYHLWEKQLNNCKKILNNAVSNGMNDVDPTKCESTPATLKRNGDNTYQSLPAPKPSSNAPNNHVQAHLLAFLTSVRNRDGTKMKHYDMETNSIDPLNSMNN